MQLHFLTKPDVVGSNPIKTIQKWSNTLSIAFPNGPEAVVQLKTRFKTVSTLNSIASFPTKPGVVGSNPTEPMIQTDQIAPLNY